MHDWSEHDRAIRRAHPPSAEDEDEGKGEEGMV
jgi:hypothetical protein